MLFWRAKKSIKMTETDEDYGDFIKKKVVVEKRETFMKLLKHLRVNCHG